MGSIIKVEHLSYVYNPGMPNAVTALDDVSFEVEEGDFVGIIGATGSGKSTLITHMNGLNKPTSGKIYIDGRDLWADPEKIRDFRFLTGLVFQYPEYQLFEETCYKDIAFGPKNMGLDEAEIDRRVHEAADFVGLDPALLERSPFELSGGQKRRVAVAGVMAMKPRILVLDEPAAGLDPEGRDDILSEVKEYHKKTGTTVLLVSHSMEDIAKYANRVLVMSNKKIAMYDTVEKVFARAPELLELGLSVPQVTKIFLKLREMGVDVPADVYTIPYAVKMILEAKRRRDAGEEHAAFRCRRQADTHRLRDEIHAWAAQRHKKQRPERLALQIDSDQAKPDAQAHRKGGDEKAPAQQRKFAGTPGRLFCEDVAQAIERLAADGTQGAEDAVLLFDRFHLLCSPQILMGHGAAEALQENRFDSTLFSESLQSCGLFLCASERGPIDPQRHPLLTSER